MSKIKRVFHINCTDMGSTGSIIESVAKELKRNGCENILCAGHYGKTESVFDLRIVVASRFHRAITHRVAKVTGNRYGMSWLSTWRLTREIKRRRPDVVHVHCANGSFINIYQLMGFLRKNRIPTVVTNHAEFYYTGNCSHADECDRWHTGCGHCPQRFSRIDTTKYWWNAMRKAFADFPQVVVTSVSPWVLARAESSPIMYGVPQRLVQNGVDTEVFAPCEQTDVWSRYGICAEGKRVVLFVTACFYGDRPGKGSNFFLRLAERFVGEDVVFVVAGRHANDVDLPENVILVGQIADKMTLAEMYGAADVTLITSKRETFSMPVAESMCCGTPVVGFKAGGPESIAIGEYSEFVDFADVDALAQILRQKWLQFKTPERSRDIRVAAEGRYSERHMVREYISIYEELTGEKKR